MRWTMLGLCLLACGLTACDTDRGGNDTGPVWDVQRVPGPDSGGPDTRQPDVGPDLSARAGGVDCNCAPDNGGDSGPPLTCESIGWECLTHDDESADSCPLGLHPTDFGDCEEGTVCCAPGEHCFEEGQIFDSEVDVGNCCPGLVEVGNGHGSGNPCSGQTKHRWICTACGDGVCGPFENPCNCSEDCPVPSEPTCQTVNYDCEVECAENEYDAGLPGCPEGQSCCSVVGCLPAGQVVMEAYPERCCDGLQEISATSSGEGGACDVDPDGEPVCAACPDGTCDVGWENTCNCPEDCDES